MRRSLLMVALVHAETLALLFATSASGQDGVYPPEGSAVRLEVLRPSFEDASEISPFTMAYFLSGRWQAGRRLVVVAEVPFAHAGIEGRSSDNTVGNPYLGVERGVSEAISIDAGVRLPLSRDWGDDDLSRGVGIFSSPIDRFEAFLRDVLAVSSSVRATSALGSRVFGSLRLGGVLDVPVGESRGADPEVFAVYGGQLWFRTGGDTRFGAGIGGRALLTDPDLNLGERTLHEGIVWLDRTFGRVRPGVQLRLPLDSDLDDDLLDVTFGAAVTILLGS